MHFQLIVDTVQQYSYFGLLFLLWLGVFGMPIPDEIVVMVSGLLTARGLLHTIPAFLATYAGVVSGLSIGYVLGKFVGTPSLKYLEQKGLGRYTDKATELFNRFGTYSLVLSYLFPVIRHVVPYIVGITIMPYPKYAAISYTTGLAWTLFFFIIGRFFGSNLNVIASFLIGNKTMLIAVFLLGCISIMAKAKQ
jgi:membrane-associated protein